MTPERFATNYIETGGLQMCASALTFSKIGNSVIREAVHNPSQKKNANLLSTKLRSLIILQQHCYHASSLCSECPDIRFFACRSKFWCCWNQFALDAGAKLWKVFFFLLRKFLLSFFFSVFGKRAKVGVLLLSKPNLVVGSALVKTLYDDFKHDF